MASDNAALHSLPIEQRVLIAEKIIDDIKDDVKETRAEQKQLQAQLIEIHKAVLAIGNPKYSVLSGFALVAIAIAGGLWKLAIDPVNADIGRLYAENKEINLRLEDGIKLLEAKKENRDDIEGLRADLKARIEELSNRLKRQ